MKYFVNTLLLLFVFCAATAAQTKPQVRYPGPTREAALGCPGLGCLGSVTASPGEQIEFWVAGKDLATVSGIQFQPSEGIEVTNLESTKETVHAMLKISPGAALGKRTFVVTSPGGNSNESAGKLNITTFRISNLKIENVANDNETLTFRVTFNYADPTGVVSSEGLNQHTNLAISGGFTSGLGSDDALGSQETEKRLEAAEKIGSYGEAAAPAIPPLVEMLRYWGMEGLRVGNQRIFAFDLSANAAANALSLIGKPAMTPLRALLTDGQQEPARRQWAARALARMKYPTALKIVLDALTQSPPGERANLLPALRDSESSQALDALLSFVTDADAKVRKGATRGLSGKKDPRVVDALVMALRDTDRDVRGAAAGALIDAADPRTFDPLVQALKDTDSTVRNLSSQALGAIKDRRAIEPLIEIVTNDKEELVRFQAGRALEMITGESFGQDAVRWRSWWEKQKKTP